MNIKMLSSFIQCIVIQRVRAIAEKYLSGRNRIELIEPLDAIEFHNFTNQSYLVLTDSGGIQERFLRFGKPVCWY